MYTIAKWKSWQVQEVRQLKIKNKSELAVGE